MSEHYYTQKHQYKSKPQTWNHTFDSVQYTFTTHDGVFAKTRVEFGSRLLINQFRKPAVQVDILDLGCGYGPIGIMIANKYRDEHIVMTDINERAVMLAKQNVKQNQIINAERSEEHTSELQSRGHLVCRLLLEKKKKSRRT